MRMIEFAPSGEPRYGLPISLVSEVYFAADRWKPRATMADLGWTLALISGSFVEPSTTPHFMAAGRLCIPLDRNQRVRAGHAGAWVSMGVTPVGEFVYAAMRDIDLTDPPHALPNQSIEGAAQVLQWLRTGERGASSEALCRRLFGVPRPTDASNDRTAHPLDPADFRRCQLFLDAVPVARQRLNEVASMSQTWAHYIARWDELEALFRASESHLLYGVMQQIQDQASRQETEAA